MGMDFEYVLYVERSRYLDLLERLGGMAAPTVDGPVTLVLPDRAVVLPFAGWIETGSTVRWDDPAARWDFMTVLCFERDQPIDEYLEREHRSWAGPAPTGDRRDWYDARGRAPIGIIYLEVARDLSDAPPGTGEDLVRFSFGTPGTTMSILFTESESIRRSMITLLETCGGVCGILDREDPADLLWLRGVAMDEVLPTAGLPLVEIERLVEPGGAGRAMRERRRPG